MDLRQTTARLAAELPLAIVIIAAVVTAAPAAGLTDAERDGYLVWLHSLETTIAAREAAGHPGGRPSFPLGILPATGVRPIGEDDLREVALALGELESRPRLLQEPAGRSTLHALNRARNYAHLAEFDSALHWYDVAARRDEAGEYTAELGLETMVAAVAAGDSVAVVRQLLSVFGGRDLPRRRAELELSYRFLIARDDSTNLELLTRETAARPELLTGPLAYWHAFALTVLDRWQESLDQLCTLLAGDGRSHGLDEDQRTWVLVAVPDLLLLTDRADEAAPLYRALAASSLDGAATWASCQAAAMDFLAGRYLDAGTVFERICEGDAGDPWHAYACSMAELSDQMERLRREGEPHGAAAYYQR